MAECIHGEPPRFAPDAIIANLPESQGTIARHRCAICAYQAGLSVALGAHYVEDFSACPHGSLAPIEMIESLAVYQGGVGRHRCVHCAYNAGFRSVSVNDIVEAYSSDELKHDGPTEVIRERKERRGQQLFRAALLNQWNNRCPITHISDVAILVASHIVPWSKCQNDYERLNKYNGILLSPLWDAAFDKGLISFTNGGEPIYSTSLSQRAQILLESSRLSELKFADATLPYIEKHRHSQFRR